MWGSILCKSEDEVIKLIHWATLHRREWEAKTTEYGWEMALVVRGYGIDWADTICIEAGIMQGTEDTSEHKSNK